MSLSILRWLRRSSTSFYPQHVNHPLNMSTLGCPSIFHATGNPADMKEPIGWTAHHFTCPDFFSMTGIKEDDHIDWEGSITLSFNKSCNCNLKYFWRGRTSGLNCLGTGLDPGKRSIWLYPKKYCPQDNLCE